MASVTLRDVRKAFGPVQVIKGVDLHIEDGQFCVFVGPSGCGKSTLLRMVAGLEDISFGRLAIGGKDMVGVPSADRGVAMVFQSYALYPHMTVRENMGFGLRMTGHPKEDIARRTDRAAKMLQLDAVIDRRPSQLSGGQRQRVAIGRAIVREPGVFLFDEPLSNLDAALRVQMRLELGKLHQELGTTMIYVTHDQVEAMTMADQIVVLRAGLVEQVGTPRALYEQPRNAFVAGFIGSPRMNFLPARVADATMAETLLDLPGEGRIALPPAQARLERGQAVTLGVRPEHMRLADREGALGATVERAEYLGAETVVNLLLPDGTPLAVRVEGLARIGAGTPARCVVPAAACHLFDAAGDAILNARSEP